MEIVGIVLGCLVVGYAFAECARHVSAQRSAETAIPYPRARIVRRLVISSLVLFECGVLVFMDVEGAVDPEETSLIGSLAVGCLLVVFVLLWRDVADVRSEVEAAKGEISRELHDALSPDVSSSSDESHSSV
jgi:hypothetical protein